MDISQNFSETIAETTMPLRKINGTIIDLPACRHGQTKI